MEYTTEPEHTCVLLAEPHVHRQAKPTGADLDALVATWRATARPESETVVTTGGGATFVVTYTGFESFPMAQAAYQSAVDIWANHIQSSVPIVVTAEFAPLGTGVLGSAGPFLIRNYPGAPLTNTWYPYAIADAIAGTDQVPGQPDLRSRFSSNFSNWYFGTDANPPVNQYDFRSVVLHELGHGLGFSGSGRVEDASTPGNCSGTPGIGCWGRNGFTSPQIFDRFVQAQDGTPMLNTDRYPNPGPELATLFLSQALWAYSVRIDNLPFTSRGQLYAPSTWDQGSSFSHWDEGRYYAGNANALMSPQIGPGERYTSPGPLTCAFFADMGWPLGPGCAMFVADESQPEAGSRALQIVGQNPFATRTELRLTLDAPQVVDAGLYDVTGRRVRTLFAGDAPAGATRLTVEAAGLASGLYTARVVTAGGTLTARVVVAR